MAKDKKTPSQVDSKDPNKTNYYKINTEAVDRLVNADKMEIPKDDKKKFKDPAKEYRSGILDRIPAPVKALFVKFWFNGAVCFFIFWGLGLYLSDILDMIFVMAIVLGMVNDILTNGALRFIETIPNENNKWMMFPQKKYWTFIANIFYSFLVLFSVVWLYESINGVANAISGTESQIYLGVEPIFFGIFYVAFDLLFIGMKYLMKSIIKDAKDKVNKQ